jgi:hypothetical protein
MTDREFIESLLADPNKLLLKKPFYRGVVDRPQGVFRKKYEVALTDKVRATVPTIYKQIVSQAEFAQELDPYSHKVLFDENVPSITIKSKKNGWMEIEQYRMAFPYQVLIRDKQVRHLCVNPMFQTLLISRPTEKQNKQFTRIKQAWAEKNMEGAKTKFVQDQKSYGDAGLLFYIGDDKRLHTRNISYDDGYTIITHKDQNGRHVLECLYYCKDDIEYLDCYDDTYMTRFTNETYTNSDGNPIGSWRRYDSTPHGFSENPLITKRGEVAWNRGQRIIDSYEALYNTLVVVMKRHGWGILYVKGQFNDSGKRIAGNYILNDTSGDPNADAKTLSPADPSNMNAMLNEMEYAIQKATGTTFILPKDINLSGDPSGVAVELTQELDMATAQDGVIEWQNVANKMMRLFVEGLAKELVVYDTEYSTAITDFAQLRIQNEFVVWKPKSDIAHNQMVAAAKAAGIISRKTGVEKNTLSTPDELARIDIEEEETREREAQQARQNEQVEDINNTEVIDVVK